MKKNTTKVEVNRVRVPGGRPNEWMLGYRKIVDESRDKTAFILDLDDEVIEQLEAIKSENIKQVGEILNEQLYKKYNIRLLK